MRRALLLAMLTTAACAAPSRAPVDAPGPRHSQGGTQVAVYLDAAVDPLPKVVSLALAADGATASHVPLALEPPRASSPRGTRGTLLARGAVPAGRYAAVVLHVASGGATSVEKRLPLPFAAVDRSGTVIAIRASLGTPSGADTHAGPSLEARIVPRPATGLLGFAACPGGGLVAMLDKRTGDVVGVVPAGRGASGVALDEARRRAYVALSGEDAVAAIDVEQGSLLETRALRTGDEPTRLALTTDGRTLVVANAGSGTLAFLEAESLSETDRVTVGNRPSSVLLDRAGNRAYVTNRDGNSVAIVDVATRRLVRAVGVDAGPILAQLDAAERTLWILYEGAPYLDALDVRTFETLKRINLGFGATAFRLDTRTGRILVARRDGGGLDVYDPLSLLPVESIPLRGRVSWLSIDGENQTILAGLPEARAVAAHRLVGRSQAWFAEIGEAPDHLAIVGGR